MSYSEENVVTVVNIDHTRILSIVIVLRWTIFALFHIGVLLIFLLYVWYFEQSPLSLYDKEGHCPFVWSFRGKIQI
jgi:hypothetical protein